MPGRLHTRFAVGFAALLIVLGLALAVAITHVAERYHAEVSQRLNAGIAMYVTDELSLLDARGVNNSAFRELARRVMTVNPSAEVYLLSPDGRVLQALQPRQHVARALVDLAPVRRFLSEPHERPLYGEDPSHPSRHEVFSAAPVMFEDRLAGYLYVVLGSQRFESVVAAVRGNYSLQLGLIAAACVLLAGFALGVALFVRITLPLRRLARRMAEWTATEGEGAQHALTAHRSDNEILLLHRQFDHMADRIERQLREIESREALRHELITNVSHDLRTPLASLHGYVETVLMKGEALPAATRREYLEVACQHARRLERRIAALFELSKLESGAIVPNFETFSLSELLQDVALRFRLRANQLGVDLVTRIDAAAPRVRGDIALVERILENLLDNSLHHTSTGGRVSLEMQPGPAHVHVTVSDTGTGVAIEDLPHVFERYFRGDTRREGTGLGLAIVRRIVELHGESVSLRSTPGIGTSIEFGLPIAHESAAALPVTKPAAAR
ncbi:MAG: sensor histidine kinase [Steroidobacteraceae bacterium]